MKIGWYLVNALWQTDLFHLASYYLYLVRQPVGFDDLLGGFNYAAHVYPNNL